MDRRFVVIGIVIVVSLVALFLGNQAFSIQTGSPSSYCTLYGDVYVSYNCRYTNLWVECDRDGETVWKTVDCHTLCGCTICGDGYCDTANGEAYSNCPSDCNPPTNPGYCNDVCTTVGVSVCETHHVDPSLGLSQYECVVWSECSSPLWNLVTQSCQLGCCDDKCCENKYYGTITVSIGRVEVVI